MEQAGFLGNKVVQASLEGREARLAQWLSAAFGGDPLDILSIVAPPAGSGFSAENYFIDVARRSGGASERRRFVLRRMSSGRQMFPDRDFGHERQIQEFVRAAGAAPAPAIFGFEDDAEVLGNRFYLMEFVEGEVPPTNPNHHEGGLLADMSVARRNALWLGALTDLGQLHRKTHVLPGLAAFDRRRDGRSAFAHEMDYWRKHYASSTAGKPLALMSDVDEWLRAHEPAEQHLAVCWGDARLGNAVFGPDGRCRAFIDWELFSIGDPIRDLAYWLYTDDHFVYACGKKLEGWPSRAESIAAYEAGAGFSVDRSALDFYRIYQGYLVVSTLSRLIQIKKEAGQMPADLEVNAHFTPVSFLEQEWDRVRG